LRKTMLEAMAQSKQVLEMIDREESGWIWAKNAPHQGKLQNVLENLRTKMTPFHIKFISENVNTLKKNNPGNVATTELYKFSKLAEPLAELVKVYDMIVKKHECE
jgi:hypothetical protein